MPASMLNHDICQQVISRFQILKKLVTFIIPSENKSALNENIYQAPTYKNGK